MTLFISCKTTVIERTFYYVPDVDFPEFPKLGEVEKIDGKIATDEEFFRLLLMFRTKYFDAVSKYYDKKNLYEGENENE